jgi:SSS family solute:Na+ symporter
VNLPLAIILACFAGAAVVGLLARRGQAIGFEQWALGNRGFGTLWMLVLLNGENSTTFTLLGASGWAYGKGVAAFFVLGYGCIAYVAGYWMMPRVWAYAKAHRLVSFADYFALKYQSRALGIVVSVVALLGLASLLTTQLRGLSIIIAEASDGALPAWAAVAIGTTVMVGYILVSGIRGCAAISVFKDVMIVGVAGWLGVYFPRHYFGGIRPMFAAVAAARPGFMHLTQPGCGPAWYTSTVLLVSMAYYMYPHTFTALYASRNARVVRRNNSLMPLAQFIILLMFLVGFTAILTLPELRGAEADLALLRLVKQTLPPWGLGLVGGVGVLMAVVPGSVILLNAATIVSRNLYREAWAPAASEARQARVARIALPLFAVAVAAFVLARHIPFVGLLVLAASVLTQLFPAFIFSVFPARCGDKYAAFAGIAVGGAIAAWFGFSSQTLADAIPALPSSLRDLNVGLVALAANFLVFLATAAVRRRAVAPPGDVGAPPAVAGELRTSR